ncbi:MAG: response regulator [Cyclobacteriaceae bacterium]|nr:response regulator [Cyclobacteriaceae bacterium]
MSKTVLIIDDSSFMREFIEETLESEGWDVIGTAADGNSGVELALEHQPDLITLDNVLPDMLGIEIAKILKKEEGITSKIIMISALGQDEMIKNYEDYGIEYYLVKPFTSEELIENVNNLF